MTRLWCFLNKRAYHKADKLVVLGRDMTTLLTDGYAVDQAKIHYIPHWSAKESGDPMAFDENPMAKELGLTDKFVVQYSGNMGAWHDIDILIEAADLLKDNSDIHFLFIGDGSRRAAAEAMSREMDQDNVSWLEFMPIEKLPESLTCCHVSLISLRAGFEGIAIPSKLYGILASGRAIVAQVPEVSEVAMVVREENCGRVVAPGDREGLAVAIKELAANRDETAAMGTRARAAYKEKYTLQLACDAHLKLWDMDE